MVVIDTPRKPLPPHISGLFEPLGYEPTSGQYPIILDISRFKLVTGGLQSGKTELATKLFFPKWNDLIDHWQPCVVRGIPPSSCGGHKDEGPAYAHLINGKCDPSILVWLVGSEYIMCEEEYNRIYQDLHSLGLPASYATRVDAPGYIRVKYAGEKYPRLRIDVKSEARPDRAFSRVSPHLIIACEAGQLSYNTYRHLNSRTIGRRASLWLIGTIEKAQPWFPGMSEAWALGSDDRKSHELPTWSNDFLFPGGLDNPEIQRMKAENPQDFFMERIAGKAVPPEGLVFKEFNIGVHVREDVQYVPGEPVYIWVDPGYQRGSSAHAVEIGHKIEGQYRIFDELHEYEMTAEMVIDTLMQRPWWKEADKKLSIDPFYKDQHHANGSQSEIWMKKTGLTTSVDNHRVGVNEQDTRLRTYLHVNAITNKPGIVFSPTCKGVISEFGATPSPHSPAGEILAYRNKLDINGNILGNKPDSKYCDGIRALEAGIVDNEGLSGLQRRGGNVTRRGGQPINTRRRRGGLPHERYEVAKR